MTAPVTMHHHFEFVSQVDGDSAKHRLVADEVMGELRLLAPLLIRERILRMQLEDIQDQIKEFRK